MARTPLVASDDPRLKALKSIINSKFLAATVVDFSKQIVGAGGRTILYRILNDTVGEEALSRVWDKVEEAFYQIDNSMTLFDIARIADKVGTYANSRGAVKDLVYSFLSDVNNAKGEDRIFWDEHRALIVTIIILCKGACASKIPGDCSSILEALIADSNVVFPNIATSVNITLPDMDGTRFDSLWEAAYYLQGLILPFIEDEEFKSLLSEIHVLDFGSSDNHLWVQRNAIKEKEATVISIDLIEDSPVYVAQKYTVTPHEEARDLEVFMLIFTPKTDAKWFNAIVYSFKDHAYEISVIKIAHDPEKQTLTLGKSKDKDPLFGSSTKWIQFTDKYYLSTKSIASWANSIRHPSADQVRQLLQRELKGMYPFEAEEHIEGMYFGERGIVVEVRDQDKSEFYPIYYSENEHLRGIITEKDTAELARFLNENGKLELYILFKEGLHKIKLSRE